MTINTIHFGPVAIDESLAVEFPQGLPGFEQCRRFAPLEHPARAGLIFLQSLERPDLCFVALPARTIRRDYELSMTHEDLELLGWAQDRQPRIGEDVAALALLAFEPARPPTANLLAPLVLDIATRRAVQSIRPDNRYGCQDPVLLEQGEAEPDAVVSTVEGTAICS
jgi:flagellar assembly factor FliW